jgi:hypothetical protein
MYVCMYVCVYVYMYVCIAFIINKLINCRLILYVAQQSTCFGLSEFLNYPFTPPPPH